MNKRGNKKGQLYIFAALILCIVLFFLLGKNVFIEQEPLEDDFERLSENYNHESAKFINYVLAKNPEEINKEFAEFTADFTAYSKNQNPDFMLIYAFKHKGNIYLGNYLNTPAIIKSGAGVYEMINGCFDTINRCIKLDFISKCTTSEWYQIYNCNTKLTTDYPVSIIISGVSYKLKVDAGNPEIVIISRESVKEQRKIYMNNEFVSGQRIASTTEELKDIIGTNAITSTDMCWMMHSNDEFRCKKDDKCEWDITKAACIAGTGG